MTNNGGKILGPIAGGLLVQFYGFTGAFMVLVALDLVSAVLIWRMRLPERSMLIVRDTAFFTGIRSGIGHSFSDKFVLGVLTISLLMNGMGPAATILHPGHRHGRAHGGSGLGRITGSSPTASARLSEP